MAILLCSRLGVIIGVIVVVFDSARTLPQVPIALILCTVVSRSGRKIILLLLVFLLSVVVCCEATILVGVEADLVLLVAVVVHLRFLGLCIHKIFVIDQMVLLYVASFITVLIAAPLLVKVLLSRFAWLLVMESMVLEGLLLLATVLNFDSRRPPIDPLKHFMLSFHDFDD